MNKEITIYELLGLIKDGQDVGKFWWNGCIHEVDEYNKIYDTYCRKYKELTLDCLNDKVKIIEEDKKIEKIEIRQDINTGNNFILNKQGKRCYLTTHSKIIAEKINELTDEINALKEKNEN